MACGAATKVRHFCLSLAIFCRLPHEWFNSFISASMVRRHVILGLPLCRFPSGVQKRAVLVRSCWSFLKTCPIHLHLLLLMMVFMFSWLHLLRSWLEILFGQNTRRILLRLFVWKVESLCWSASVILQHSEPYNRVGITQLLYSFSLIRVVYWPDFQTFCKLLNAALAFRSYYKNQYFDLTINIKVLSIL